MALSLDPDAVSKDCMAKLLGVVIPTLDNHIARGCPKNPDGTYNIKDVFAWVISDWRRRLESTSAEKEKERKTHAEAILAEIKIAKMEKSLVDREMVMRSLYEHINTASRVLDGLENRLAQYVNKDERENFKTNASKDIKDILRGLADLGIEDKINAEYGNEEEDDFPPSPDLEGAGRMPGRPDPAIRDDRMDAKGKSKNG